MTIGLVNIVLCISGMYLFPMVNNNHSAWIMTKNQLKIHTLPTQQQNNDPSTVNVPITSVQNAVKVILRHCSTFNTPLIWALFVKSASRLRVCWSENCQTSFHSVFIHAPTQSLYSVYYKLYRGLSFMYTPSSKF